MFFLCPAKIDFYGLFGKFVRLLDVRKYKIFILTIRKTFVKHFKVHGPCENDFSS